MRQSETLEAGFAPIPDDVLDASVLNTARPPASALCAEGLLMVTQPDFAHLAAITFTLGRGNGRGRGAEREQLRQALPRLLESFEEHHGRIVRARFGTSSAAAALTDRDELTIVLGYRTTTGPDELIDVLRRCEQISYTGWHRLAQWDRRLLQRTVWSVVEDALRLLDETAPGEPASPDRLRVIARLGARLDEAEDFMLRCSARRTQARYLKGMLAGSAVTGLVLVAALVSVAIAADVTRLVGELLLIATAGAVGAVTSVLSRMTSDSSRTNLPNLDSDMKTTDVRLVGALRPVVGLVFALAIYVLVEGAAIPVDEGEASARTALLTSMGFLAGFSERFAQDMFVRSGHGLAGTGDPSPATGPAAGLAGPR